MGEVTSIHSKKMVPMICRDCGHTWERKEADPGIRHRCPRCKKYDAVVAYSQVAGEKQWACTICQGTHFSLNDDGLQCFKCGNTLSPLMTWTHVWSSGYGLHPRQAEDGTWEDSGNA